MSSLAFSVVPLVTPFLNDDRISSWISDFIIYQYSECRELFEKLLQSKLTQHMRVELQVEGHHASIIELVSRSHPSRHPISELLRTARYGLDRQCTSIIASR
jgi:hypothetical protein